MQLMFTIGDQTNQLQMLDKNFFSLRLKDAVFFITCQQLKLFSINETICGNNVNKNSRQQYSYLHCMHVAN